LDGAGTLKKISFLKKGGKYDKENEISSLVLFGLVFPIGTSSMVLGRERDDHQGEHPFGG
jgi:hypothetical protein